MNHLASSLDSMSFSQQPRYSHLDSSSIPTKGFAELEGSPVSGHRAELEGSVPHCGSPRPASSPKPSEKGFVSIGIDFGTTFSGVSWAYSEDPDTINEVASWPSLGQHADEPQVPTQIDLDGNEWGYLALKSACPLRWIKLLLLNKDDVPADIRDSEYLRQTRAKVTSRGSDSVVDIISRFLEKLWDHTLDEIQVHISADDLDSLLFRVAITVPAIWPQYAREKMREAARRAGIIKDRLAGETFFMLVEEPEAAALATLFERRKFPEVKVGEVIVVCDAGGGTVDIISYKITSLEPFMVEEFVRGDGKLCGAFLVDEAFEGYMRHKAGLKIKSLTDTEFRTFVNEEWEHTTKRTFSGKEGDDRFDVRPPQRAFSMRKRIVGNANVVPLKKSNIVQFFSKSLSGTKELIGAQITGTQERLGKTPRNIILVGGLGSSRYMYNQLQAQYNNVLSPSRPWSAVARGATIKLLRSTLESAEFYRQSNLPYLNKMPDVSSRIAKLSYGVECGTPAARAVPPYDKQLDRVTKDPDGRLVVWRMRWYIKRSDMLDNRSPVTFEFYELIKDPNMRRTTFKIYTSDADPPPCRKTASVRLLCEIGCDLEKPFEELPKVPGTEFRRLDNMVLGLKFEGEPKWALQVGSKCEERAVDVKYVD